MDPLGPFRTDQCVQCGECFARCPVMHLPLDEAKREVKRLVDGQVTRRVEKKCTSCFTCNFICPEHCNPASRIIDRWNARLVRDGLPARAKYFTPDCHPNFRTYVMDRLPADEKELVSTWADTSPCDEVFYPGCNVLTVPYMTRTRLLDGLTIRGALDLCCGEMYFRTGQYAMLERTAERLNAWRQKLGFSRMIIPCTAGRNMFTNVLPRYGFVCDFEVQHLLSWLDQRVTAGAYEIKNPLNKTVTIQDSCHAKFFGDDYMDLPRRLLEHIGATVTEQALCRENTLCCGIGGGFSQPAAYHPVAVTLATARSLAEAGKTGADLLAVYCAGCMQMLAVGQIAYPNRMPIWHVLELLSHAIGETPQRLHKKRAWQMFAGTMRHQVPALFSTRRFVMPEDS